MTLKHHSLEVRNAIFSPWMVLRPILQTLLKTSRIWPKNYWPPSSPNFNFLDFSIWRCLAQFAYLSPHKALDSLKRSLQTAWDSIKPGLLRANSENEKRLFEVMVEARSGFLEVNLVNLLKLSLQNFNVLFP